MLVLSLFYPGHLLGVRLEALGPKHVQPQLQADRSSATAALGQHLSKNFKYF